MIGPLLALVPRAVLAGVAVAALAAAGLQTWRLGAAQAGQAEARHALAQQRAAALEVQARAEAAARAEETRRTAAMQEVQRHARRQIDAARADAADARTAAERLRQYARDAAAGGGSTCDPANTAGGDAAPTGADLLADLLGRAVHAAVELAAIADARGAAGEACQRAYGTLTEGR